ncbi:MAG: serine/threonine-protein kinase [Acidobacteriota bacterium]
MIGTVVGNCRITDVLGDGGLGPVYRAVDRSGGGSAAVRLFAPEVGGDPKLMERLRRLIPVLQRVRHPNIGAVYDMVTVGPSAGMLVEYVPGATIDRMRRREGKTSVGVAVSCAVQALRGLEHAHALGLYHHSIRPTNLVATPNGTVKLVDLGLGHAFGANRKTREDRLATVMAYLAPEQIRNQAGDARADIYALGIVLYEMVTGRLPFDHQTEFAVMQGHLQEPPTAPGRLVAGIPDWVDVAVLRALAKVPDERFKTASDMCAVLESGLGVSTSGSVAVVRGVAGVETAAMFTEAPPIPGATTVRMGPEETLAMPAPAAAGPMTAGGPRSSPASRAAAPDDETIVLPVPSAGASTGKEPSHSAASPVPPVPGAFADATVLLPPGSAGELANGPLPHTPPLPAEAAAPPLHALRMETSRGMAAGAPGRTESRSRGPSPPRGSSRLVLASVAVVAALAVGLGGLWLMTRPRPLGGDPAAGGGTGTPGAMLPPGPAGTPPPAAVATAVDSTEVPAAEVRPPISTVPPPPEPGTALPPPASQPRRKPAPPKAAADASSPEAKPQAVIVAPVEPAPAPPPAAPLTLPRPALPDLSFQKVKLVTEQDGKAREIDVLVMFLSERMAIAPARGGAIFRSVGYRDVSGAGYTKAEKRRLLIRSAQHLFTIESSEGTLLLRLDKDNVETILQAFEARTGIVVVREE